MRNTQLRKKIKRVNRKPKSELRNILPKPAELESYEEIHPGFTKEIIRLAEKEQAKHFALERFKIWVRFFGKILSFILVLFFIMALIKAIKEDNLQIAWGLLVIIFIISLPQIISIFSVFRHSRRGRS